jgi:hypothetical protein
LQSSISCLVSVIELPLSSMKLLRNFLGR